MRSGRELNPVVGRLSHPSFSLSSLRSLSSQPMICRQHGSPPPRSVARGKKLSRMETGRTIGSTRDEVAPQQTIAAVGGLTQQAKEGREREREVERVHRDVHRNVHRHTQRERAGAEGGGARDREVQATGAVSRACSHTAENHSCLISLRHLRRRKIEV